MQEVAFLKQNAEKWRQLEHLLDHDSNKADPDKLAKLFVAVTDDLAYARTFYPRSKTTVYLNQLASRVHQLIYRNKREDRGRLVRFWTHELPQLFYDSHRQLFYAFAIFLLSVCIGAVSAANDHMYVRLILGDQYVNMTEHNINSGDPMAVYKKMHQMDMSVMISINNIRVAFLTFAGGILASIGTIFILFQNGIMLGSFQYFFYQKGLLLPSVLTIWIHGTLEISAIVIAGCAGLVMGNSILFPGTYPRMEALRRGAKQGLKIVIGLVPIFVTAAFLEGFVTRHTAMPLAMSLFIILGSLAFILWYFVIYPIKLNRESR